MRKTTFLSKTFLATVVLAVCWAGAGWAVPVYNEISPGVYTDTFDDEGTDSYGTYTNSGDLLFVEQGNNNGSFFDDVLSIMQQEAYFGPDFEFYATGHVEVSDDLELDVSGYVDVVVDDSGRTGTWDVVSPLEALSFYAVKGGDAYGMYWVDPAAASGSWSTYDLWAAGYGGNGGLEISHFTGYSAAPVPEPASMFLLGVGLAGIAGVTRGRIKKKRS